MKTPDMGMPGAPKTPEQKKLEPQEKEPNIFAVNPEKLNSSDRYQYLLVAGHKVNECERQIQEKIGGDFLGLFQQVYDGKIVEGKKSSYDFASKNFSMTDLELMLDYARLKQRFHEIQHDPDHYSARSNDLKIFWTKVAKDIENYIVEQNRKF